MDVDPVILFILVLAGTICGAVDTIRSHFQALTSIGVTLVGLAGVLYWWP